MRNGLLRAVWLLAVVVAVTLKNPASVHGCGISSSVEARNSYRYMLARDIAPTDSIHFATLPPHSNGALTKMSSAHRRSLSLDGYKV